MVFPDFVSGVQTMREVAAKRIYPASIRLVDNMQVRSPLTIALPLLFTTPLPPSFNLVKA